MSATGVAFGSHESSPPRRAFTGTVGYPCLLPLSVQITLSTGAAATFTPRKMTKGAERLNCNFYRDAGRAAMQIE